MKIRRATKNDFQQITELWLDCFDDSKEYVRFYLERRFSKVKIYLLVENKTAIGMIHLLPCELMGNKAYYWYAVGILRRFRGRGYFRSFASNVLKITKKEGYANLCKPVDGLFDLYRSLGFRQPFLCRYIRFQKENDDIQDKIDIGEAKTEDYSDLLGKEGSVLWDRDAIDYALKENLYCGGKNIKLIYKNKCYLATAIKENNQYFLTNSNITADEIKLLGSTIISYLNCDKLVLREFNCGNMEYALCDLSKNQEGSSLFFTLE